MFFFYSNRNQGSSQARTEREDASIKSLMEAFGQPQEQTPPPEPAPMPAPVVEPVMEAVG